MFCKQAFHISHVHISQKVKGVTYYFHIKTQILADFQICISVPLNVWQTTALAYLQSCQTSKMVLFAKKANSFQSLTIPVNRSVLEVLQDSEYDAAT